MEAKENDPIRGRKVGPIVKEDICLLILSTIEIYIITIKF